MAIQKKSLIGTLSATKKAIVAKGAASEVGTVKSEAAPVALKRHEGITLKKHEGITLKRGEGITLKRGEGITLKRGEGITLKRDGFVMKHAGITLKK